MIYYSQTKSAFAASSGSCRKVGLVDCEASQCCYYFNSSTTRPPLGTTAAKPQKAAHLGQGLIRLLRGAAVSLGDVTEGEGHVLQREVANK